MDTPNPTTSRYGLYDRSPFMNFSDGQDRLDGVIAGAIILTTGVIGMVANISAIVLIYRTPSFHNAFGYICASHLIADVGVLIVFSFWSAPAALFNFPDTVTHTYFGGRMGQLAVSFFYCSIYSQLQTSLNRLLAISSPLLYTSMFSTRRTKQILVVFWILGFLHGVPYLFDQLPFPFDSKSFLWEYPPTKLGQFVSFYIAFLYSTFVCAIVIIIDTAAFFAIVRELKRSSKSSLGSPEAAALRRNIHLYVQGCLQASGFILISVSFHIISRMVTTKFAVFATTTLAWELTHAVDGFILIVFHEKFRVILCQPLLLWQSKFTTETASSLRFARKSDAWHS